MHGRCHGDGRMPVTPRDIQNVTGREHLFNVRIVCRRVVLRCCLVMERIFPGRRKDRPGFLAFGLQDKYVVPIEVRVKTLSVRM